MKKTGDGNNQKPVKREHSISAADRSVNQVRNSSKPPSNAANPQIKRQPAQRPLQNQVQRTAVPAVRNQGQKPVQKPAPGQPQRPVQRNPQNRVQRPPQKPAQKTVQRSAAKPVQKQVQRTEKKPAKKINLIPFIAAAAVIILAVAGYFGVKRFLEKEYELVIPEMTIEAGSKKPDISMYLKGEPALPKFLSCNLNFDEVNINLPQTIRFTITMYGKNFPCVLTIVDTVAPTGEGIPQSIFACQEVPDALSCVTNIQDVTDVTAAWYEVPDMSRGGRYNTYVVLTDAVGNQTYVGVPFDVTLDSTAPVIKGYQDLQVYIGESIAYKKNIILTDDYDSSPVLDVDVSKVDLNTPGKYDVTYIAKDFSGNESTVTVKLKVSKKPKGYVEPDVVYAEARKILDEITEPGMTQEEVALQIVWWCRYNIRFNLRVQSSSWTEAAYNAYTKRIGNCYSTVYAVKALLDVAGIENMIIERYPYQTATHYWNYVKLNGQWYHCDSTWRKDYDSYFFMYTTSELLNFWQGGWNGFQFKQKAFPESATESVQKKIDYKNHKIIAE